MNIYGEQLEFLQRSSGTGQLAFSPRHIASLPNIGETDIFRSLQLLPGIQMGNTGFAGLYIRGGTPDQNQIILDGMSIYQVDHFFGFFSAINSNIVKDVQVYKGGFPAKYGGRIASIIDINRKIQESTKKDRKIDLSQICLVPGSLMNSRYQNEAVSFYQPADHLLINIKQSSMIIFMIFLLQVQD